MGAPRRGRYRPPGPPVACGPLVRSRAQAPPLKLGNE